MVKTAQRPNRAFKIAHWADVQRIYYTATLTAFCHHWALCILAILIPSALTALQFLAALHRSSKLGYMGCAVAYELLAPRVALATGRPCSVRTLERGLAYLRKLGLCRLTRWTMPDQTVANGPDNVHRIHGTQHVETAEGEWTTRQIKIIVLTQRALALWDKSTVGKGSDVIPHFAPFLTSAKMAANPKDDLVVKPTKIKQEQTESDTSTSACHGDPESGQTTRPPDAPAAVEQLASTGDPESGQTTRPPDAPAAVEQLASTTTQQPMASDLEGPNNAVAVTTVSLRDKTQTNDASGGREGKGLQKPRQPLGSNFTPPPIPRAAKNKTSWPVARAYLLVELHRAVSNFSQREADAIYGRALYELSTEYPKGWPTVVDWSYWVGRFATFSPQQRMGHMVRDILPLLRSTYVPVPAERERFIREKIPKSAKMPGRIADTLDPFLQRMWERFVKK